MKKPLIAPWRAAFARRDIPNVEKILLALMLVLFVQFFIVLVSRETHAVQSIDVIQRSMAATIFGYFIGGNVAKSGRTGQEAQPHTQADPPTQMQEDAQAARIGFAPQACARVARRPLH